MKSLIFFLFVMFQLDIIFGLVVNQPTYFESINYNVTHLKTGDASPAKNTKLRLYGMRFCPFTQRVVLALNAKNLEYDLVLINLKQKPDWFYDVNKKGTVPVLQLEDQTVIIDSSIISVYLDEQYPAVPLQATEPLKRAQDKIIAEIFAPAWSAFNVAAYHPGDVKPSTLDDFNKGLEYLESVLESRSTKYLLGNKPGLIDFSIWPFLERFAALPVLGKTEFVIDEKKYTKLGSYIAAMKSLPEAKVFYLSPEIHAKFIETKVKSQPDFDLLTH